MLTTTDLSSQYLAGLAVELTMGVLKALTRAARQKFEAPPQQQALLRCYGAAPVAVLPENDPDWTSLQPGLQQFFARSDVQKELSSLARGRELDQEMLVELFEETAVAQALPDFDFAGRLADFVEAFLQAAEQEQALADIIKIGQLRQANASLLSLVTGVEAIRRAVEQIRPGSGGVSTEGDIQAKNIFVLKCFQHVKLE